MLLFFGNRRKFIFRRFFGCAQQEKKNEKVLLSGLGTHEDKSPLKNQQIIQMVI
jgi:hypothetical protein